MAHKVRAISEIRLRVVPETYSRGVFDHVTIRASDREASQRFYATVLATLGVQATHDDAWFVEWRDFSLAQESAERPATRRLHVGFVASDRAHVDAFWEAGVAAGYASDGAPGLRPEYGPDYYGGFLLDPDGNSAEAVHHDALRSDGGIVDHLWIRVAGLAAARDFYARVAGHAGFRLRRELPDRVQFAGATGTFSLVGGPPTANLHLAFPSPDEAVDAFHADLVAAGYADEGPPGERPIYHPGYYGAFVRDPDGNVVELVDHHR
jgi:catechol 2,3-dioxygenase-like lactoylglutathione lyase family enzyme